VRNTPRFRLAIGVLSAVAVVLLSAAESRADWNSQSIAVPALGNQGVASAYPSSITVAPPGGPGQRGEVRIMLHNVTHPCPRDLAVLLVKDDALGYLLMSNAASCAPLKGTTLLFVAGGAALAGTPASGDWGASGTFGPSIVGGDPVFPAPAPAGPYVHALPPAYTLLQGVWKLYVVDTADSGARGVIAGGWSVNSPASASYSSIIDPIPARGTAVVYPLPIDCSAAQANLVVSSLQLTLRINHTYPADLRILLQSPSGNSAIVMGNAGGSYDITASTPITFSDSAASPPPQYTALVPPPATSMTYTPGHWYGTLTGPPSPGPGSNAFLFQTFAGEPVAGVWKLWVWDVSDGDFGDISATLTIAYYSKPSIYTKRPAPGPFTSPYTTITLQPTPLPPGVDEVMLRSTPATWRSTVDGVYYSSGAASIGPQGDIDPTVPLKKGVNQITVESGDGYNSFVNSSTVSVTDFKYYLSEGATGFFHTDITLQNMGAADGRVSLVSYPETGAIATLPVTAATAGPTQVSPNDYLPSSTAFSTLVWSQDGAPLAVERGMFWDARYYGGHAGEAVDGAGLDWYFAEGAQGFFGTYLLLEKDTEGPATVQVTFLRDTGGPFTVTRTIAAHRRDTVDTSRFSELRAATFGIHVHADVPITAERSMYFSSASRLWVGGHESPGVKRLARKWFLAEGATGSFFQCYVLVGNPNAAAANLTFEYLLPDGSVITQTRVLGGNARYTEDVKGVDPRLRAAAFSTIVTADQDIVVERAMYWPGSGWQEAHNAFGVAEPALRWGLADVRVGGEHGFETFILLANPNATPAEVRVTFRKVGQASIAATYQVAPRSRFTVTPSDTAHAFGQGVMSAEVEVLNYQPIAVEKAMYWNADGVTWAGGSDVTASRLPPR
jgi:subtilisin-like proprotein convertase family protein